MAGRKRAIDVVLSGELHGSYQRMFGKAQAGLSRYDRMLHGVDASQKRTRMSARSMAAGLGGVGAGLMRTVAGYAAAYIGTQQLAQGIRSSLDAYKDQERADTRLATLMGNVRGTTQAQIAMIKAHASELQRLTTIGDEVSQTGASQLATYQLQAKSIKTLMPSLADLAAGTYGVNVSQDQMQQSANLLGKVFTGQVGALRRVGISFSKTQEKVLKLGTEEQKTAMLAQVIAQNYGGLAQRLAQTDEGKIIQMTNAWGDMKEVIGGELMPIQMSLVNYLHKNLPQIQGGIHRVIAVVKQVGTAAKPAVMMLVNGGRWIVRNWGVVGPIIKGLAGAMLIWKAITIAQTAAQLALNLAMTANPIGLIIVGVGLLIGLIVALVKNWDKVRAASVGAISAAWSWLAKLVPQLQLIPPAVRLVGQVFAVAWKGITSGASTVWNWIKRIWDLMVKLSKWTPGAIVARGAKAVAGKIAGHAEGGIVRRPTVSWVGERGPEAIIPLANNRRRAAGLWRETGAALGLAGAGGGISVNFAPVINLPAAGSSPGNVDGALRASEDRLIRRLRELEHDRDRRSFR